MNAAAMDTRIKATVTSTMYDMSRVIANGYFDYEKDASALKKNVRLCVSRSTSSVPSTIKQALIKWLVAYRQKLTKRRLRL